MQAKALKSVDMSVPIMVGKVKATDSDHKHPHETHDIIQGPYHSQMEARSKLVLAGK